MTILFGILGLGLLMVVHETGHYLAARAFKMRVTRFSIGFGPALARHTPKGSPTTYQIAIIPLLAYVQIAGMNPLEEVDPNDEGSYANASLVGRITTIVAGPLANYLSSRPCFFSDHCSSAASRFPRRRSASCCRTTPPKPLR
jgi:regulator of sigma E protease